MARDFVPLYYKVENELREEIASGRIKEGDLIPSEKELAERFNVSQGTVRKAILALTDQGILYRKQGKGTFVVVDKFDVGRLKNFRFVKGLTSELVNLNITFIRSDLIQADQELSEKLKVRTGESVFRLERIGRAEDGLIFLSYSYLPGPLYPGLEDFGEEDFLKNTLYKIQEFFFKIRLVKKEEFLSAMSAPEEVARTIGVMPGSPLLMIELLVYTADDRVVEFRKTFCRPDGYKFYVRHESL